MAVNLLSLRLFSALLLTVTADPSPGRIPKVYNALITSNQNLETSKSYPIYQPVLHDPFGFAVHPSVFYGGELPFGNGIVPQPVPAEGAEAPAEQPQAPPARPASSPEVPLPEPPAKEPEPPAEQPSPAPDATPNADSATQAPPPPPNTESPIPLNEFGLPSQILPLGRFNPAYNGFTQLGPYSYSYPGVRLYDPYDPFNLSPYGYPFYRQLPNVLGLGGPNVLGPSLGGPILPGPNYGGPNVQLVPAQAPVPAAPTDPSAQTPPPEPSDLNVLNYSSKDPAIPNVPPPPLPQGGLKSDKNE